MYIHLYSLIKITNPLLNIKFRSFNFTKERVKFVLSGIYVHQFQYKNRTFLFKKTRERIRSIDRCRCGKQV